MMMTDDELRGSMRKAADKRAQVGILAELNAVSEDQMRAKLTELGVAIPGRKPRTTRVLDPEQALALIGQGLTDAEISRRLGVNKQTVGDWRRAQGIPANSRRKPKRAPEPAPSPAVPAAEPAGTTAPASGISTEDAARAFEDLSRRVSASNDAPALCGPAEVVPAWAVTVGGRPALYLSRRALADAVQAIIDLDVELREGCRDGKDDH